MKNESAHILVVDDAPLICKLLKQVLEKYNYVVDTVKDGKQAIDFFTKHHPDLILMDADMPILDGVTACARIKQLPGADHLPIVMVTALVERQWIDRAYAAGAIDYVTKPVNLDVLRNRIHRILTAKRAEEALFEEKEKALVTLASIGDGVITTDASGQVEYLNAVAAKLTGWCTEEAQGLPLNQVFSPLDENTKQPLEFPIQRCLEEGKMVELESQAVLVHRYQKKRFAIEDSAAPIKDRNGHIIGVVLVFHDVTETRKMTQELAFKAKHDALTGLYNRHEFQARLKNILHHQRDETTEHIIFFMDLDRFKIVNDTCGHEAGDQLLKNVALILQQKLETHHTKGSIILARLGGDEFGLLLENCPLHQALEIANNLCISIESFKFFWETGTKEKAIFSIGISIGLVPISNQIIDSKSIIAMADAACYAAKNAGRNGVHIYQENDESSLDKDKNIRWVSLINDNLEKNQGLTLFYQSIIPLDGTRLGNHYEILLRMTDQQNHLLPPGTFLSAAARYHLMPSLDIWVIRAFLEWLSKHPQHLEELSSGTINISGYSLAEPNFLNMVIGCLNDISIPTHKLCFEISEVSAITNLTDVLNFITTLKKLGYRFALDNFGSGMASFAYLKSLPVDILKIDGTLIKNIVNDMVDYAIVKSINDIAHITHLKTIAESVENQAILDKIKEIKVDYVQGYWISNPKPLLR
jgi:diguanylate cyclase (GGDEF)-like protein/PAS domain S-box-containing protein